MQAKSKSLNFFLKLCILGCFIGVNSLHAINCKRYLEPNLFETGFKQSKVAVFEPGSAKEMQAGEAALLAEGIHVVMIKNPSPEDIAILTADKGYHYGPLWLTNHQPVRSYEEYINSIPDEEMSAKKKKEKISAYHRKLRASEKLHEGVGQTEVRIGEFSDAYFQEWYALYKESILSRDSGADAAGPKFATSEGGSKGELHRYQSVSMRDEQGQLIGGYVLEKFEINGERILKVKFAAFKKGDPYDSMNLAYRAFDETVKYARDEGFDTISYGSDPNLYGNDLTSPGLLRFKRELGFVPTYWQYGPFAETRILKVLNPEKIGDFYLTYQLDPIDPSLPMTLVTAGAAPDNLSISPVSTFNPRQP